MSKQILMLLAATVAVTLISPFALSDEAPVAGELKPSRPPLLVPPVQGEAAQVQTVSKEDKAETADKPVEPELAPETAKSTKSDEESADNKMAEKQTAEADLKKDVAEAPKLMPLQKEQASEPQKVTEIPMLQPVDSVEEGFVSLITADLEGWDVHEGKPEAWAQSDDVISCISYGGGWLRTHKQYSDFVFRMEYRIQEGGNTGVGVRCPDEGNPTFTGIEVQLLDDTAEKYASLRPDQYTGSVYYRVEPTAKPKLNKPGEWNECEISCIGEELIVKINGDVVNQVKFHSPDSEENFTSSALKNRPPTGFIALQSHTTRVDFRKIRIKNLAVETKSGLNYVELATGEGAEVPANAIVTVHYVGQLADGKRFTDSRELGEPVTVSLDSVIDGWKEGIAGMKVGGRRRLIVPPELAYGEKGLKDVIPPDATLVFEVEVCDFKE